MRHGGKTQSIPADLRQVSAFRTCNEDQLALVDRVTDRATVLPGRAVLREGTTAREVYVVMRGTAVVTEQGRIVSTLRPGDLFGEDVAIDGRPALATVTALSPLELLVMTPRGYASLMANAPGFREAVLRSLVRRLRALDEDPGPITYPGHDAGPPSPADERHGSNRYLEAPYERLDRCQPGSAAILAMR